MRNLLTVACLLFALALVATDVIVALRPSKPALDGKVSTESLFGETAKAIAEKSPRLAAAILFVVLAGFFADFLVIDFNAA